MRHFLDLNELPPETLRALVEGALARKARRNELLRNELPRGTLARGTADADPLLAGRCLALIFEKASTRTRLSFDVAMNQLGGRVIVLDSAVAHLERGESMEDTAGVLSTYADGVMLRTTDHARLLAFAGGASVPVINGLSDLSHPCQIIAALMTIREHCTKPLSEIKIAWVGDSNNVLRSWIHAAPAFGFTLAMACPEHQRATHEAMAWAKAQGATLVEGNPKEAATGADILTTDCWVSLNDDESEAEAKRATLAPYQINEALFACASPDAFFMHCLPLYRGEEVSAAIADGARSLIFQEAENRIHAQKAILLWALLDYNDTNG